MAEPDSFRSSPNRPPCRRRPIAQRSSVLNATTTISIAQLFLLCCAYQTPILQCNAFRVPVLSAANVRYSFRVRGICRDFLFPRFPSCRRGRVHETCTRGDQRQSRLAMKEIHETSEASIPGIAEQAADRNLHYSAAVNSENDFSDIFCNLTAAQKMNYGIAIREFSGNSTIINGAQNNNNNDVKMASNRTKATNLVSRISKKQNQKRKNSSPLAQSFIMALNPKRQMPAPILIFPWSFWIKLRTVLPNSNELNDNKTGENASNKSKSKSSKSQKQKQKRWDIPLTSKPFQGFENLQSTVYYCILAISVYFLLGTIVFPFWLEPKWTVIDGLYFSMTTLTTVGYGDLVVSGGGGFRGILGKAFILFFNIYAVCISVSALSVIAKLALNQQKKIVTKAKEKARNQLIEMFDLDDDDDYGEEEDDDDDDDCRWVDQIYDDKCESEEPETVPGVLFEGIKGQSFNFALLAIIAALIKRVEGWSLIDIIYYWNCTATTLGFGDLAPATQLGRLLAVFFIPLSVVTLGEIIANCFAFVTSRAAARAEKDFIRREVTLSDLEYLDVNEDGRVDEVDFITFMLVAMQKVDKRTMKDLKRLFHALDAGKDGFIQKEDLITLRQRKRLAKKMRRKGKNTKKWLENEARSFFS